MQIRRFSVLGGTIAVLSLISAGGAFAAGTSATAVSVRVEGLSRTLLSARTVTVPARGFITRGGTPKGQCATATAAGALNAASHGRWAGSWDAKYAALSVTAVLGENHALTSKDYWSIWVNGRYAPAGICGLKLHRGEQLLFAAVPDSPTEVPIVLRAPARTRAGHSFTVRAGAYNAQNVFAPLAGVRVPGVGTTNATGTVTATARRAGKLSLTGSRPGYIRAEAKVTVTR